MYMQFDDSCVVPLPNQDFGCCKKCCHDSTSHLNIKLQYIDVQDCGFLCGYCPSDIVLPLRVSVIRSGSAC